MVDVQHDGAEAERLAEVRERGEERRGVGPAGDGESERPGSCCLSACWHVRIIPFSFDPVGDVW